MIRSKGIASFAERKGRDLLFPPKATDICISDLYSMHVQGQCSRIYVFSISYCLENRLFAKDFVLKTYKSNAEERIEREYRVLNALRTKGVPVPAAIALESDPNIIGAPFIIMEKINGASASNFLDNKEDALAIVDMLAKLLASLHKVDSNILLPTCLSGNMLAQAIRFRESVLSDLRHQISIGYITSLSPLVRRKYLKAVEKLQGVRIKPSPMVLIHADFGPDHVLLSDKGPVIIDWEGIRLGDPAYDIGWLYHIIRLEGQIMIDHRFVRASKEATFDFDIREEFVECYKRYTGSVPENLEFYKNVIALKLAATLDLHIRLGYPALSRSLRLRPKEILSQTLFAYSKIASFKRDCEVFLKERSIL